MLHVDHEPVPADISLTASSDSHLSSSTPCCEIISEADASLSEAFASSNHSDISDITVCHEFVLEAYTGGLSSSKASSLSSDGHANQFTEFSLAFYRGVQHPPFNSLNDMHTPFPLQ